VLWNIDTRIRDVNSASSFVRTENKVESHHGGVHYKGTMRTGHCARTADRGKKKNRMECSTLIMTLLD